MENFIEKSWQVKLDRGSNKKKKYTHTYIYMKMLLNKWKNTLIDLWLISSYHVTFI